MKPPKPSNGKARIKKFVYEYETYSYTNDTIVRILALMVQEDTFLPSYRPAIQAEFFEQDRHRILAELTLAYFDQHGCPPARADLQEKIAQYLNVHSNLEIAQRLPKLGRIIYKLDLSRSVQHLIELAVEFGAHQAYKKAVTECFHNLLPYKDKRAEGVALIQEAINVAQNIQDLGSFWFEGLNERLHWQTHFQAGRVKTGLVPLDTYLDGGLGQGEVGMIVAPTNYGKTTMATRIALTAVEEGKKVIYFTLEQSKKKIETKMDSAFFMKTRQELRKAEWSELMKEEAVRNYTAKTSRNCMVRFLPAEVHTLSDIRSYLMLLKSNRGFVPDLIVIDSPDLLLPMRKIEKEWEALGSIYNHVCAMAAEMNVAIWTTSDTKVAAYGKDKMTAKDVGNSYKKARKVDVILMLAGKEGDQSVGQLNLYLAKIRDGESQKGRPFPVEMLWQYSTWSGKGGLEDITNKMEEAKQKLARKKATTQEADANGEDDEAIALNEIVNKVLQDIEVAE